MDFGNLLGVLGLSWAVLGCLLGLLGVLVAALWGLSFDALEVTWSLL